MQHTRWTALVDDPIYTLNIFKDANEKINFAKWENTEYKELLESADREINKQKRCKYLFKAESILIEEVPVIPISYEVHQYLKRKEIVLPTRASEGNIDFKWVRIS